MMRISLKKISKIVLAETFQAIICFKVGLSENIYKSQFGIINKVQIKNLIHDHFFDFKLILTICKLEMGMWTCGRFSNFVETLSKDTKLK